HARMARDRLWRPAKAGDKFMTADASRPTALSDPFRIGLASGWKVIDASAMTRDLTLDADVVIVGTGAGGGTAAEILSDAGLSVVLVEEGPLATSADFHMLEAAAYSQLYQESSARKSKDRSINILQGRCVGGGTTVNWTSSFRTPAPTLEHWALEFGLEGFGVADLMEQGSPAFEAAMPILSQMLKAETTERDVRSVANRIKAARFPSYK